MMNQSEFFTITCNLLREQEKLLCVQGAIGFGSACLSLVEKLTGMRFLNQSLSLAIAIAQSHFSQSFENYY